MDSSIDRVLQTAVDEGAVPNVVAIAADRDGLIYEGAAGPRTVGEAEPVSADSEFRIMSMTKMVATVVALQLVEQGALDLDAPVGEYCPEFDELKVLTGFEGDQPRFRDPASRATVKQLMTHTSGLGYWFWSDALARWEQITSTPNVVAGLEAIFNAPLLADPGTSFRYGINIDWLGRVIQSVSGLGLDVAVKQGVTGPLGMDQTTFSMDDAQRAVSTPVHVQAEDGQWVSAGEILNESPEYWAGGHGLYSTPRDYIRFQRALLRNGELDGVRILQAATVDAAFQNQIGDLEFPADVPTSDPGATCDVSLGPGLKWGYGLLLNPQDVPGQRRAWSGAWAGLCNTHFWVDRASGLCASIYSNFLPFATPASLQLYGDFEAALYASR
jgi:CubicO group peptidase (beta-lactamase class C family)